MQWIQEQNPVYDSKVIMKVHDLIDGGGSEFKISQDQVLEYCKPYKDQLDSLVKGWMLHMAGFPKKDLTKLCRVVSDTDSRNAFETGLRKGAISQ
ncbi:hypothetical protein D3C81_582260 [compost metagenome]